MGRLLKTQRRIKLKVKMTYTVSIPQEAFEVMIKDYQKAIESPHFKSIEMTDPKGNIIFVRAKEKQNE